MSSLHLEERCRMFNFETYKRVKGQKLENRHWAKFTNHLIAERQKVRKEVDKKIKMLEEKNEPIAKEEHKFIERKITELSSLTFYIKLCKKKISAKSKK